MSSKGFVVWFTGLSGAGKSTLAERLRVELEALGRHGEHVRRCADGGDDIKIIRYERKRAKPRGARGADQICKPPSGHKRSLLPTRANLDYSPFAA